MHNYDRDDFDTPRGIAFALLLSAPAWALTVALVWLGMRSVAF